MIMGFSVPAHVAGETVDGETIVIDFLSGAYHTLEGASASVWTALQSPQDTALDEGRLAVLSALVAAGLVEAQDGALLGAPSADAASVGLTSYTDMVQLLVADPVHEVDERGWPILRKP